MFRDDAQACRAIRALLSTVDREELWGERGPSELASELHRRAVKSFARRERVVLGVAWTLWRPTDGRIRFGQIMGALDAFTCEVVCSLLAAYASGPEAVDQWLEGAAQRQARREDAQARTAEQAPTTPAGPLVADWPSIDDLTLRYIHRVIEREGGNKERAASVLGIDRRTVVRTLARERRRRGVGRPPAA